MPLPRQGWRRRTAEFFARVALARRCPASLLATVGREKARLLESNRALGTAHGGSEIYRRERPLELDLRPPPRPADARDRELDPRFAADFLPPELRAADFRPPDLRPPERLDGRVDDFRLPDDAFRPDFLVPEDLDAPAEVFLRPPPEDLRLLDPPDRVDAPDLLAPPELPDALEPPEPPADRLDPADVPALRVELEDPAVRVELEDPLSEELERLAPPNAPVPAPEVEAGGTAAPAPPPNDPPPEAPPPVALLPPPKAPPPVALPPPEPVPAKDDSCFLPDPFGRPLLPRGAPPPNRSSSSSSSSSSPSATTVASVSASSSSSESSALSQRRSL